MPRLDAHIAKAVHNIKTMKLLTGDNTTKDWVVTVAFYAALHIVDAVLYEKNTGLGRHGRDHATRDQTVKYDNRFTQIWRCYRPLQNESIVARYLQFQGTPPDQHIVFDARMPDEDFISFIKGKLGGLIQSAANFLPKDKYALLQNTFQTELGAYLGLRPVTADTSTPPETLAQPPPK